MSLSGTKFTWIEFGRDNSITEQRVLPIEFHMQMHEEKSFVFFYASRV